MLDLTKNIRLEGHYLKQYRRAKIVVFLLFIMAGGLVIWNVLFPSQAFAFFFRSAGALKNTLISPRTAQGDLITDGRVTADSALQFDAPLTGNYSRAEIELILEKDSAEIDNDTLRVNHSYQAFFYPQASPLGFTNGSLLRDEDDFYAIANNSWRKFESVQLLNALGYTAEAFQKINPLKLQYNPEGSLITEASGYPDGAIFAINDEYYQLVSGKLHKFVSTRAYLSHYLPNQAIPKEVDFLQKYPLAEEFLGFADGTLVSDPVSGYIISGQKKIPINSERTFVAMGFSWPDVQALSGEELGIYPKGKLFNLDQPHPNGTIFLEKDTGKYFYIQDGTKRPIVAPEIVDNYLKNSPIIVENKSLTTESSCELVKKTLSAHRYICTVDLTPIKDFPGNDYQFALHSATALSIQEINIQFKRELSTANLRLALSELKKRLLQNYGSQ